MKKKNTHPPYQKVLFVDSASGHRFICGSTLQPSASEKFEGVEYPVYYLSTSSTSHPLFTGSKQLVDAEGRVQKFRRRFGQKADTIVAEPAAHKAEAPVAEKKVEQKSVKVEQKKSESKPAAKPEQKKGEAKAAAKPAQDKKGAAKPKK